MATHVAEKKNGNLIWKPLSDLNRTPESVGEIQAVLDNDLSSKARDMKMSEIFIRY